MVWRKIHHLDLLFIGSIAQADAHVAGDSSLSTSSFDALRYSGNVAGEKKVKTLLINEVLISLAFLAGGILLFVSLISLIIYVIRKHPAQSFFCPNKLLFRGSQRKSSNRLTSESSVLQQQQLHHQQLSPSLNLSRSRYTPAPDLHDLPPSYYSERARVTQGDCYEPPPYPGPPIFSSVQRSDSIYYETIKTPSTGNSMSMLHPMPLPEPRAFTNTRTHRV